MKNIRIIHDDFEYEPTSRELIKRNLLDFGMAMFIFGMMFALIITFGG